MIYRAIDADGRCFSGAGSIWSELQDAVYLICDLDGTDDGIDWNQNV